MSEIPPSPSAAPAAPAPAQRKFPTWAIVIGVVALVCVCVGCVGVIVAANSPFGAGAMAGGQLVFICMEKVNDNATCSAWANTVSSTPEFNTCINDLFAANNFNGNTLYACLEDAGVGP